MPQNCLDNPNVMGPIIIRKKLTWASCQFINKHSAVIINAFVTGFFHMYLLHLFKQHIYIYNYSFHVFIIFNFADKSYIFICPPIFLPLTNDNFWLWISKNGKSCCTNYKGMSACVCKMTPGCRIPCNLRNNYKFIIFPIPRFENKM